MIVAGPRASWLAGAALGFLGAAVVVQCFVPPVVGLADNGDFEKVMPHVGLRHLSAEHADRYFGWMNTKYAIGARGEGKRDYLSSETLLVRLAVDADRLQSNDGLFDIRVLGALHAALFLAGLALTAWTVRGRAGGPLAAVLLALAFSDVGYVSLMNTMYSQTASLAFLLLALGAALRGVVPAVWPAWALVLFYVSAALYVTSKPQGVPHAVLLAAFGLRLAWPRRLQRRLAAVLSAGLLLLAAWYLGRVPASIKGVALYNVVYHELLPHSPTPASHVVELGGEASWTRWSGTHAFAAGGGLNEDFTRRVTLPRLLVFYARHPDRLLDAARRGAREAFRLRVNWGNLDRAAGRPALAQSTRFTWWSDLRQRVLPGRLWFVALLLGAGLAGAVVVWRRAGSRRGRLGAELLALAVLAAAVEFVVCTAFNAHLELNRHLFVFQALTDLLLVAGAAALLSALARAWKRRTDGREALAA